MRSPQLLRSVKIYFLSPSFVVPLGRHNHCAVSIKLRLSPHLRRHIHCVVPKSLALYAPLGRHSLLRNLRRHIHRAISTHLSNSTPGALPTCLFFVRTARFGLLPPVATTHAKIQHIFCFRAMLGYTKNTSKPLYFACFFAGELL